VQPSCKLQTVIVTQAQHLEAFDMIVCACAVFASCHLTNMPSLADAGAATAAMSEPQTSESEGEEATKAVGMEHSQFNCTQQLPHCHFDAEKFVNYQFAHFNELHQGRCARISAVRCSTVALLQLQLY
jgi:hypothetical protein